MVQLDPADLHPVLLLMVQDMVVLSLLGPLKLFLDMGGTFQTNIAASNASINGHILP